MVEVNIQKAMPTDFASIWPIFKAVIQAGDTYAYSPTMTGQEAKALWFAEEKTIYKAIVQDKIVGTYYVRSNQPGLGSHVANAGFMVDAECRGQGLGRRMGLHALEKAREQGYSAMQFNSVVSTNTHAVALWESLGFQIVGTIPKGFNHQSLGLVDLFVMHRFL